MYYPSSENKGADQLCGYREADLRLCFRICRLLVLPRGGSILYHILVKAFRSDIKMLFFSIKHLFCLFFVYMEYVVVKKFYL